jgi:hypothetical protein
MGSAPAPAPRRTLSSRGAVAAALIALAAAAAAAGGALLPRAGGAQPPSRVTFAAAADGYVSARQPRRGFAAQRRLLVARSPVARVYLRFTVDGVGGTVTRATLRLRTVDPRRGGRVTARLVGDSWRERSLTLARAPGPLAGPLARGGGRGWLMVDVTRLVRRSGVYSFAVAAPAGSVLLHSREAGRAFAPRLVVETQAAPGVVAAGPAPPAPPVAAPAPPPPPPPPPAPPAAAGVVVAAVGDIACSPGDSRFKDGLGTRESCRHSAIAGLVAASGASALLALGDVQYERGSHAEFLGSYDRAFGRFKAFTYPAVGNHEYLTADAAGYYQYFGAAAGEPSKGYYSFDLGVWHLVAINSNCATAGGCHRGSPQEQWLRADLAAHPAACTLAFWHHPRYNSGKFGDDGNLRPIWEALVDAGAEVALAGHAHNYERFAPQDGASGLDPARGVRQFVVGTGGANHTPIRAISPHSEVRNDDTYGILQMTLRPTGYDWRFVPEPGGAFTDSGSDVCH